MNTYELSGETSYRIYKKYFYIDTTKEKAIAQFKQAKGKDMKKIKVKQVK